jgi:hypothetical protein
MLRSLVGRALALFCAAALVIGAVKSNGFKDARPRFPSLQSMMEPDSTAAQVLAPRTVSASKASSTAQPSGLTYLEFYSEENCGGSVTYSSGYKSNVCLPANDYVRPPFADDDEFYYKFPFQSLRITDLTGQFLYPCSKGVYIVSVTTRYYSYRVLQWLVHDVLHRSKLHRRLQDDAARQLHRLPRGHRPEGFQHGVCSRKVQLHHRPVAALRGQLRHQVRILVFGHRLGLSSLLERCACQHVVPNCRLLSCQLTL